MDVELTIRDKGHASKMVLRWDDDTLGVRCEFGGDRIYVELDEDEVRLLRVFLQSCMGD